jgi:hypothetical protein
MEDWIRDGMTLSSPVSLDPTTKAEVGGIHSLTNTTHHYATKSRNKSGADQSEDRLLAFPFWEGMFTP